MARVVVLGATGFIGSAATKLLDEQGHEVIPVTAPRLKIRDTDNVTVALHGSQRFVQRLIEQFTHADAVINAAGNPNASEQDEPLLNASNAVLPGIIAQAVTRAGVRRFVHVSSAVVQGRADQLDQTEQTYPFSAYSRSKARGEDLVRSHATDSVVIYRPPSVHAPDRRVTRALGTVARSPFATVARPASAPSPQTLIGNVASAIAYLATTDDSPPQIVSHPAEGVTTGGLLAHLGGRNPRQLPRPFARAVVRGLGQVGRKSPSLAANARRLEMMWFGQKQGPSWLTSSGWAPPQGADAWQDLGRTVAGPS